MKKLRLLLWGLVALAFIIFIALALPKNNGETSPAAAVSSQPVAGFDKGAHFTLQAQNGETFNSDEEISDNEYALIFFGFTHCPVICPTELQKFAFVMDNLPDNIKPRVHPLFITVDPERDTVETMREYVPMFHPSITGLSGDPERVKEVLNDWKVYFSKVEDPQYSDYTMDHTTYAYFVDSDMKILAMFRMQATTEDIVETITDIVAPNN